MQSTDGLGLETTTSSSLPDVLTIYAHNRSYKIYDPGGKIGDCLRGGEPYERRVLEHIYRLGLPPDSLAVDVGAGVGNHALWLSKICKLKVLAFEPLDFKRLFDNRDLNNRCFDAWAVGLSDVHHRAEVRGAPVHVVGEHAPKDGKVWLSLLDYYELEDVKLLKIDVEGMEPNVLRGGADTIRRCRPVIYAEAMTPEHHARNAEVLEGWGYKHTKTFGATPLEEWMP